MVIIRNQGEKKMKLKQLSVENLENLTNKMIDIKTLTFTPNEFIESSMICSEELINSALNVIYKFSVELGLKEKFYTDFFYKILNNKDEEIHIKRLKFIGYCWLNTEK